MKLSYKFKTKEDRDQVIQVIKSNLNMTGEYVESFCDDEEDGDYILNIYTDDDSTGRILSYNIENNEPDEKNEEIKSDDTLKKILKYTAIGLIGVIIGRKTCRYKKWKGSYPIYVENPELYSKDWYRGVDYAMNALNEAFKANNLTFCVDKKYRRK